MAVTDNENSTPLEARKCEQPQDGVRRSEGDGVLNATVVAANSNSSSSSSDDSSSETDSSIPEAPDGGWGWMVVGASFFAHLIADGCGFSIGVLFTEWLDVFGESKAKTAFVSSLFVSMPAICGPVASIITNKFGCRLTTAAGGLIAAVGCLLSCFANSIDVLCVTFGVIGGFGLALVYVPAVVVVAFYFESKRAFATGIAVAGSGIGTFIFAPLTEMLIENYSWRGAMIIIGGLMLNIVVCGALFRPLVSVEMRKKRQKYLRSLDRFSRASSRRQSREGLDRKVEFSNGATSIHDLYINDGVHHSMVVLPTYLNSNENPRNELPDVCVQNLHNSKSQSDLTLVHTLAKNGNVKSHAEGDAINRNESNKHDPGLLLDPKPPRKGIMVREKKRGASQSAPEAKKKKIRFPEHLVPRRNTDIFYRGSLLKAGFLLNRGYSASCPDIFIHANKRPSLHKRFRSATMRNFVDRIRDVADFSIFKNRMFLFFCLHSMLLYVSYDIPYVYITSKARVFGIPDDMASFLVSIVGIVSTFGQVIMGYIGDRSWINCLYFYIAMITLAGLVTLVVPALTTFPLLATYCGAFGFFISANFALTTIIVVELLGMDQLTNAYGFISLAEGLANLAGPPFAGWIIDTSGSFDLAFYLAGAVICISGLMLLIVPCVRKCRHWTRRESQGEGADSVELGSMSSHSNCVPN